MGNEKHLIIHDYTTDPTLKNGFILSHLLIHWTEKVVCPKEFFFFTKVFVSLDPHVGLWDEYNRLWDDYQGRK